MKTYKFFRWEEWLCKVWYTVMLDDEEIAAAEADGLTADEHARPMVTEGFEHNYTIEPQERTWYGYLEDQTESTASPDLYLENTNEANPDA